ncbi:hypothetical protein KR222_005883, partial [Zaprionus bogoriensis]
NQFISTRVQFVTDEFVYRFIEAVARDPRNWSDKVSHRFVGQCFRAVGMNFSISVEALRRSYRHPYREDNLTYIFNPVPFVLQGVEAFFYRLPRVLEVCEREGTKDLPSTDLGRQFYGLTRPIPCFLRVVDVWAQVAHFITGSLQRNDNSVDKFLCEPLARLSFSMLRGLVRLLPASADEELKDICLKLAVLSCYGIFYQETYKFMLEPMLDIFAEHFELFFGHKSALMFVFAAFSCTMTDKSGYVKIYRFLEAMLSKFAAGQQRDAEGVLYLRLLTNQLIRDKYLVIQFDMLKEHNGISLIMATLHYLQVLQRHVVSAEVFSRRFLEQILVVLLHDTRASALSALAAQLYIELARRQLSDQEIVVHVIEVFLKTQHTSRKCATYGQAIARLKGYLKKIMPHFSALQYFDYYLKILMASNVRDELALFTVHAVCATLELYTEKYAVEELARAQIHSLLRKWPRVLEENASRFHARNVFYSIYSIIDYSTISQSNFQLLCRVERSALKSFQEDDSLCDAELAWLFANICHSALATGNEELLVQVAHKLHANYAEVSLKLMQHGTQTEGQEQLLESCQQCVRRVFTLLQANRLRRHYVYDMCDVLAAQLFNGPPLNEYLSPFGYECLALMLSQLQREGENQSQDQDEMQRHLAQQLYEFCERELSNTSHELPHLKSMFCSIIELLLGLPHRLTLTARTYDALLDKISDRKLAQKARSTTVNCSYVRRMHSCLRDLHANQLIRLPGNRIWKLLLLFKTLHTKPDLISPELAKLIGVLIRIRTDTYAFCLSVIHLHIVTECSSSKNTATALNAHLQLVDEQASAKDAWLLRLFVFNAALELLVQNLTVHRNASEAGTRPGNHLLPLQHLMPLVDTLCLERIHFMNIARLLHSLKANSFGVADTQLLETFIMKISTHKLRCEDALAGEIAGSELKLQPPGPMVKWQAEAFDFLTDAVS